MSVIIGVRVAKKRKTTSTKSSTSTSSSSSSSKPNTTQNTTQTTTNNCNCESRLSALEQKINNINSCTCDKSKITTLENLITNLQTQFNSLSDNQLNIETYKLYPLAYQHSVITRCELINNDSIVYQIFIENSNYTDEEIYNALKFNDTYIKDSIYAPYFTVFKKVVKVASTISQVIDIDNSVVPLNIYVDLPNIERNNNEFLIFNLINRNIYELGINDIHFEIEYVINEDIKDRINIKIDYPETVQILSDIEINKFINTLLGKTIRMTNRYGAENKVEYLSDVYTLAARGIRKTYEIIIDWKSTSIPEYN